MRIVFMGTPAFAVPTLERLARTPGQEVAAVVCQPDRPAGRARALQAPAVKRAAEQLGVPIYQPERMRGPEAVAWLRAQAPDALAVVAFGQLLPAAVFELPRYGAINAHASLLPAYRGAAPIQWAIARGERRTGVTTMRINTGLDTGDVLLQRPREIGPGETAPELSLRLAELAAELIVETLARLEAGGLD
ncbi:MAG: methionyl-tRNA formyltransferase, partial [Terriglobales bacterium]